MNRVLLCVFAVVLFVNVSSAKAADFRLGGEVFCYKGWCGSIVGFEALWQSLEVDGGVVIFGYDPYDHPDQLQVTNGLMTRTSWVPGKGSFKFLLGLQNMVTVDQRNWELRVTPQVGFVYKDKDKKSGPRVKVFVGAGGAFVKSRWQHTGWDEDWDFMWGVSLSQ